MDDLTQSSALCHSWPRLNYVCELCLCAWLPSDGECETEGIFLCVSERGTHEERGYVLTCGGLLCVCAAGLTEVMYDLVPLHVTLCVVTQGCEDSWLFCRINVKWNRNIKLILSALVLRYKSRFIRISEALNWKQPSRVFSHSAGWLTRSFISIIIKLFKNYLLCFILLPHIAPISI